MCINRSRFTKLRRSCIKLQSFNRKLIAKRIVLKMKIDNRNKENILKMITLIGKSDPVKLEAAAKKI